MTIKLHNCTFSDEIICDTAYSVKETNRQILASSDQYVTGLFQYGTKCYCSPLKCERFLDKLKRTKQQQKTK